MSEWRGRVRQSWLVLSSRRAGLLRAALLIAILGVAMGLRLARVGYGLPYPVRWDEPLVVNSALRIMGSGNWQPMTFAYGSFPIYLCVLASSLAFLRDSAHGVVASLADYTAPSIVKVPTPVIAMTTGAPGAFLASRALLSLVGVATLILVYAMARLFGFRTSGLLGAAVIAVSGWHIYNTSVATVDGTGSFLVAATICASLLIAQGRATRTWYILAGIAAGLAIATKISMAPVCAVIPIAYLVCPRQGRSPVHLFLALAAIPISFLIAEPYALLSFSTFLADLGAEAYHYGFAGHAGAEITPGWPAVGHYLVEIGMVLGWAGVGLAFLGVVFCAVKRPREFAVMATFPVAYLAFMSGQIVYFDRNALPLLAAGALMISIGAGALVRQLQYWVYCYCNRVQLRHAWIPAQGAQTALALALIALVIWAPFWQQLAISQQMFQARDAREQAVAWLKENVPEHSQIAVASQLPFHFPSLTRVGFSVASFDINDPCAADIANYNVLLTSQPISSTSLRLLTELPGAPVTLTPLYSPRVLIYERTGTIPSPAQMVDLSDGCQYPIQPVHVDVANQAYFAGTFYSAHGYYQMGSNGAATFVPLSAAAGHLAVRLSAAGTLGGGRYPQLLAILKRQQGDLELSRQTIQLTGALADYLLQFDLSMPGQFYLQLVFADDFYAPGDGDRKVLLYALDAQWSAP